MPRSQKQHCIYSLCKWMGKDQVSTLPWQGLMRTQPPRDPHSVVHPAASAVPVLPAQREPCGMSLGHGAARPSPSVPSTARHHCCGALGEQQKPGRRHPGKAALEFCGKVEGEKESDVLGNKALCSALYEDMFSVICTTGTV